MMDIHEQFVTLAKQRNNLTRRLCAMLPEIDRQKVYEKKGFDSIFQYAWKIAGLSSEMVRKSLNLHKKTDKLPALRAAIPKVGVHKVDMVVTLADEKTDKVWAKRVQDMSKKGLQQLVKEVRQPEIKPQMRIQLDEEMEFLFSKVKKQFGKDLSDKEALRRMLKKLDEESLPEEKCVACNKIAEENHHPHRQSEGGKGTKTVPVCRVHHEFAHNRLIKDERAESWELDYKAYRTGGWADRGYKEVRRNL